MPQIIDLFNAPKLNLERLQEIEAIPDPRSRYVIAITPRSGSSYLCNVIKNTKRLGWPQEVLEYASAAERLAKNMPGRTPEEYLRNTIRVVKSANNISGLKASWFQFENFSAAMTDRSYLDGFKYVYLTRRDLAAQAVSLYKATASNIFHSVVQPSAEELAKLAALEYDFTAIKYWYEHILAQEQGWQRHFYEKRLFPLCISYEDIEDDILRVIKRIACYVQVDPDNIAMPEIASPFEKIRDHQSVEWARRFAYELSLNATSS